ncbi:MAG: hypothetical protein K2H71_12985, partial [Muribaculaceae bacterium]|nr:hypothetical protein [Muribaculaceae bacterium]
YKTLACGPFPFTFQKGTAMEEWFPSRWSHDSGAVLRIGRTTCFSFQSFTPLKGENPSQNTTVKERRLTYNINLNLTAEREAAARTISLSHDGDKYFRMRFGYMLCMQ